MFSDEWSQHNRQDVTHQALRLARRIDRLPVGVYQISIRKGDKAEDWRLILWDDTGTTIADTELKR